MILDSWMVLQVFTAVGCGGGYARLILQHSSYLMSLKEIGWSMKNICVS